MSGGPKEQQTFIVQLGAAMSASGQPVDVVQDRLRAVAEAYGTHSVRVNALPTSLMVTMGVGEPVTLELTTPVSLTSRLDQIALVDQLSREAMTGAVAPSEGIRRLEEIRGLPRRFHPLQTLLGSALLALGLCLSLTPPATDLLPAAVFGLLIGLLRLVGQRVRSLQVLLPVLAAFVVAALSALAVRVGIAEPSIRAIVASLVVFLPGAALTTAVMELSAGDMVSGASRLVSGAATLALLTFGILTGIQTLRVPAAEVFASSEAPLGSWVPWLGVLLFAVGATAADSAPKRSFPGLIIVLYSARAGQVLGNAVLGGLASALTGATVMTVVAFLVSRHPSAMPPHAAFLPGFWLLVPGAIGLIGLTQYLGGSPAGSAEIITTVGSIFGVALGVLCGTLIWGWAAPRHLMGRAGHR